MGSEMFSVNQKTKSPDIRRSQLPTGNPQSMNELYRKPVNLSTTTISLTGSVMMAIALTKN